MRGKALCDMADYFADNILENKNISNARFYYQTSFEDLGYKEARNKLEALEAKLKEVKN